MAEYVGDYGAGSFRVVKDGVKAYVGGFLFDNNARKRGLGLQPYFDFPVCECREICLPD